MLNYARHGEYRLACTVDRSLTTSLTTLAIYVGILSLRKSSESGISSLSLSLKGVMNPTLEMHVSYQFSNFQTEIFLFDELYPRVFEKNRQYEEQHLDLGTKFV